MFNASALNQYKFQITGVGTVLQLWEWRIYKDPTIRNLLCETVGLPENAVLGYQAVA